jgi:hypothetical protein
MRPAGTRRGRSAEGAGEHTHAGALGRAHQVMFDWLDTTLDALTRVPQQAHRYATRKITQKEETDGNDNYQRRHQHLL